SLTETRCFFWFLWLHSSARLATHVEIRPRVNLHLPCAYLLTCVSIHLLLCVITSRILAKGRHAC
ncbi:hypothetical protein COCMIDRAFT_95138, partial [Bipolaris oryzae ATCC 44560]